MVSSVPILALVVLHHPVGPPRLELQSGGVDERIWLAQEQEGGETAPLPPMAPRRFLNRDAIRQGTRRPLPGSPEASSTAAPPPPVAVPRTPPAPASPTPPAPTATSSAATAGAAAAKSAVAAAQAEEGGEIDYAQRAKQGKFSFDFAKAEIIDVVKAISNLTRRNFIIPEKIKSQRITILSPTKITANEAYQVFLSALEVNGITIVRSGKFYKLVESKDAIKTTIPTCIGPEDDCPRYTDQMVTLLLHLRYVDANQLNPVIKGLISKDGEVTVFQPSNALIVSEYAPNLTRVRRIIDALDVAGFEDELQLVPIRYAVASEVADKLTQVFDVQGRAATAGRGAPVTPPRPERPAKAPGAEGGGETEQADVRISKIVPDDRTNMLIIKANRRAFEAIRKLIDKLDIPIEDDEGVRVIYLENADAEELASTLSSLAQGQGQAQASRRRQSPTQPPTAGQPPPTGGESAVLFEGEVKVTADKSTNSLIIVGSRRDFRSVLKLIEKLDMPRRQVYVEAAILEVTVSNDNEFGLNWHSPLRLSKADIGDDLGGGGTIGFVQSAQAGGRSPTLVNLADPTALLGVAGGSVVGILGKPQVFKVGDTELRLPSFGVILKALQSSSNAQILSTPHILTTDNEEASIEVGQKIPFRRGTQLPSFGTGLGTGTGGNINQIAQSFSSYNNIFSSVDRIDVSLKLTLTPQVNERDKVRLEIDQQIEDVVGNDEATQTPITANRAAKTVVVVDDQQTVVLGGLMRDRTTDSESKVPILGDLPLLGWLFKQRSSKIEKVNLLLVLTPYIIREASDFQRIFERKLAEHEEFAAEYYGHKREYRAHIDYTRKSGPFARLAMAVRREQGRYENGGEGDQSELLITPDGGPAVESDMVTEPETIPVPPELGDAPPPLESASDEPAAGEPPAVITPEPPSGEPVD